MIKIVKNFSENPEGVLVFTFSGAKGASEGSLARPKREKIGSQTEQPVNMKKSLEVFSHESFFFSRGDGLF